MNRDSPHIILFDGVCKLCNGSVNFIIKYDKEGKFKFTTLQSESGQALLKQHQLSTTDLDTFVFITKGETFTKSTATLKVLRSLGKGWQIFYIFIIIPRVIRDLIYDLIARYRYRFFGKRISCRVAGPKERERFL